jgi:hypothetical protein
MEIRFTEFEMDDRATLALQFLGARKDRKRTFSVELRDSRCDSTLGHGDKFITYMLP